MSPGALPPPTWPVRPPCPPGLGARATPLRPASRLLVVGPTRRWVACDLVPDGRRLSSWRPWPWWWAPRFPRRQTMRRGRTLPTSMRWATAPSPARSWYRTASAPSTPTSPSGGTWPSTATTTGSGSSTSPSRATRCCSPTPSATGTRATSWSGRTSWSARGTPSGPRPATATASLIHREPLAGPPDPTVRTGCHDAGVIRGDVNLAVCASADTTNVFDIGANALPGGSLADPVFLYTIQEPGVDGHAGRWHSAAFTWDGKVVILGWEPGGGAAPECEATDPPVTKSAFFYDARTGAKLGQWTLPRSQDGTVVGGVKIDENCTIHNYNVAPLRSGRHVLVSGNYQAGTWATDFTDPANPVTLGWSDPPPLVRQTPTGPASELGGAWSSYWYNNFIYESSITEGLLVFRLSGDLTGGSLRLNRLNPQTQETSLD